MRVFGLWFASGDEQYTFTLDYILILNKHGTIVGFDFAETEEARGGKPLPIHNGYDNADMLVSRYADTRKSLITSFFGVTFFEFRFSNFFFR